MDIYIRSSILNYYDMVPSDEVTGEGETGEEEEEKEREICNLF